MAHVQGAQGAMNVAGTAQDMAGMMGSGTMGGGMMGGGMMGPGAMGPGAMGGGMMGSSMMAGGHMMPNMPMMSSGAGQMAKGAMATGAMGAAMAASRNPGGIMSSLVRHPLVVFGLGVAAGVLIYKYRKEIIGTATQAAEKGKDFVLQQRESLEDLMAECRETEEAKVTPKAERPKAAKPKAQE